MKMLTWSMWYDAMIVSGMTSTTNGVRFGTTESYLSAIVTEGRKEKMKPLIRPYIRERHFAVVASQNFLAAFGVFLAEEGCGHDEVLRALQKIDGIMNRDDNVQRLEELAQIRLDIKG